MSEYAMAIDIGGTFTDVTLARLPSGPIWSCKTPSTPDDPARGFLEGFEQALARAGIAPDELGRVFHGTTIATNTILERRPVAIGLLTTQGFGHALEIGRHDIPVGLSHHDWIKPPRPVPPDLVEEIVERLDASGAVLVPLDEASARAAIGRLRERGVESFAIALLFSYLDARHEQRLAELVRELAPEAFVSLSSEVLPAFREYERTMTTVLNAYVQPRVWRYLRSLERQLEAAGCRAPLLIMTSSGGVISAASAASRAVHTALSGPAAGAIGAAAIGALAGYPRVISLDVGGTSTDVCLIPAGAPETTTKGRIGDFPMELPMTDINTIGAGGGSIAWITSDGRLAVGPRSAGASPGPACYASGGLEPTVTDANLVLGRIPDALLAGGVELDRGAAERAIRERVASPLGLDLLEAAEGILEIADNAIVGAIRQVSIARGYDPSEFALVCFGGAGPLHGTRVAELLGIPTVLVPLGAGVLSTWGLLRADLRNDYVQTCPQRGPDYDLAALERTFAALETRARAWLSDERAGQAAPELARAVDVRYAHQGYELTVPLEPGPLTSARLRALEAEFHAEHRRLYTYALTAAPIEIVNLRVTARAALPTLQPPPLEAGSGRPPVAEWRRVYLGRSSGWAELPCYRREALRAGHELAGPAVVDQYDATTVLPPGRRARVDGYGNLMITNHPGAA